MLVLTGALRARKFVFLMFFNVLVVGCGTKTRGSSSSIQKGETSTSDATSSSSGSKSLPETKKEKTAQVQTLPLPPKSGEPSSLPEKSEVPKGIEEIIAKTSGPGLPPVGSVLSRAYAIDSPLFYKTYPRKEGECSSEIHSLYWVKGPDSKIYPTWHPPVHPATGCKFGHEHGTDPSTSTMFAKTGMPPFGYTQELIGGNDVEKQRSQPHVGYKVELSNDFVPRKDLTDIKCSVMNMFHHETTTADGLVNPLHEFFYDAKCTNGFEIHWKSMQNMGKQGEFHGRCNGASSAIVKLQNPVLNPKVIPLGKDSVLGSRSVNDWHDCIKPTVIDKNLGFGISERWIFEVGVKHSSGLDANFAITDAPTNPGRFGNKDMPTGMQYMIDICKGRNVGDCKTINETGITWDDARSPWNGEGRFTRPMWIVNVINKSGKTKWFTDVYGNNASDTPIVGGIEQFISLQNEKIENYSSPDTWRNPDKKAGVRLPN
jgi:hypothetical protein